MPGTGFPTRDTRLVAARERSWLTDLGHCMHTRDADFIAKACAVAVTDLNELRADLGLLDRCTGCDSPITGAAVFDENEQAWLSKAPEQWRRWCSESCRDNSAEGYWAHRWSA